MSLADCFGLEVAARQEGWPAAGFAFPGFLSQALWKGKTRSHQKSRNRDPLSFSFPVIQQPANTQP